MSEQEVIRKKVEDYKKYKEKIFRQLDISKERAENYNVKNDVKNKFINGISSIKSGISSFLLHYDEIKILEFIEKELMVLDDLFKISPTPDICDKISFSIDQLNGFINRYVAIKENFKDLTISSLSTTIEEVNKELSSFKRLRNIADNAKTENIYDQAVVKYRGLENDYRMYFYRAIGITVGLSLLGLFLKNWLIANDYLGNIEFWVLKFSILAVGITLITYFLKQSAHYQRLADQNYQTQVELQAYPSFMESIPTEEAASVRKELALKYFGREIDGAAHKDMSNLISDQMKSTTDMVKAATDVLKVKGP